MINKKITMNLIIKVELGSCATADTITNIHPFLGDEIIFDNKYNRLLSKKEFTAYLYSFPMCVF